MPTPSQLQLIHVAARFVRLNDEQYRTLLRSAAGVDSAKDLTHSSFEDVMAVIEDLSGGRLPAPNAKTAKPSRDQLKAIERMAPDVMQSVNQLVEIVTGERAICAENLTAAEARWLLDWLFARMATCAKCGPDLYSRIKFDSCPHCHSPTPPPPAAKPLVPLTAAPFRPSTYWRDKVAGRGTSANARMVFKIRQLAEGSRYSLASMCWRQSGGRTEDVERLTGREAWQLIEAYKAAAAREPRDGSPSQKPVMEDLREPLLF